MISIDSLLALFLAFDREAEGIIGGKYAHPMAFRYQASLQVDKQTICGASIIDNRRALTAAHCVIDHNGAFISNVFTIVAGIDEAEITGRHIIRREVKKMYVPKEYRRVVVGVLHAFRPTGDIAVLEVICFLNKLCVYVQIMKPSFSKNYCNITSSYDFL